MTLDQLSNPEFRTIQDKRGFLAGLLFTMSAEGNLLQDRVSVSNLSKQSGL